MNLFDLFYIAIGLVLILAIAFCFAVAIAYITIKVFESHNKNNVRKDLQKIHRYDKFRK